jgi:hypothetical protein
MSNACREYYPDPVFRYEPEYRTPADLSWTDAIRREVREKRARRTPLFRHLQLLPNIKNSAPIVPQPAPPFVPQPRNATQTTAEEARAMLGWGVRVIEESCQILEHDPHTGSWDVEGALLRLRNLRKEFRRRERGIE